jgi:hypothetical protein
VLVSRDDSLDADGAKVRVQLRSNVRVWERGAIELRFDRYLDPRTAIRQSYCLSSDSVKPRSLDECSSAVTTSPAYDPVDRALVLYLGAPLESATQYQLTLFAPPIDRDLDPLTVGLRAFDGVPLERTLTFTFTTAAEPLGDGVEGPPEAPTCASLKLALATCTDCHTPGSPAPANLRLTLDTIGEAVDRVAIQTQRGGEATTPQASGPTFGGNMPIIGSRSPGNSYLLYKALARGTNAPTLAEGETERLRAWITGFPMPPVGEPETDLGAELRAANLRTISRFIAAGATCTDP